MGDRFDGKGTIYINRKLRFKGTFINGWKEKGTYYDIKGNIEYIGQFKKNIRIKGIEYSKNYIFEGEYVHYTEPNKYPEAFMKSGELIKKNVIYDGMWNAIFDNNGKFIYKYEFDGKITNKITNIEQKCVGFMKMPVL